MEILATLFLTLLGVLGLMLVSGLAYLTLFNTAAVRRRELARQARQDYAQARGTAHRHLLEDAARKLNRQLDPVRRQLLSTQAARDGTLRRQESDLDAILARQIVQNHLQEVPGIGEKRKALILASVFKKDLTDLYRSQTIPGIGEQLQWSINQWVRHYKSQWPGLRKRDFPGKVALLERHRANLAEHDQRIHELKARQVPLEESLARVNQELSWLRQITAGDFVRALNGPSNANPVLNRYLHGVFAEWEPMPDWFRAVVASEAK